MKLFIKHLPVIWIYRIIRVAFGILFTVVGIKYYNEGGWPAILFGALFLVTAFLRPRRCMADNCNSE